MKIAILGSAPSSMSMAPHGDPSFKIWACSPGTYANLTRCDAFFELHRWEPGVVGLPATQKPWFSPEYVQWLALRTCPVWMFEPVPGIPTSHALPVDDLIEKYGSFFFTSSIAWMIACAIEDVLEARRAGLGGEDVIALYGVDMAANEEYGYQRAGCQHFLSLASALGITITVPPESDLLRPMPLYGIDESSHWMIKLTARQRELQARLAGARATRDQAAHMVTYLEGALDDMEYHLKTWGGDRVGLGTSPEILALCPDVRRIVLETLPPVGEQMLAGTEAAG